MPAVQKCPHVRRALPVPLAYTTSPKIQCPGSWGLIPLQRNQAKCLSADEGGKLSEHSEFLTPPQSNASRGQPKAKLLGGFSLVR